MLQHEFARPPRISVSNEAPILFPPTVMTDTCYRTFIPPTRFYSPATQPTTEIIPCLVAKGPKVIGGVRGAGRLRFSGLVKGPDLAGSRVGVPTGVDRERRRQPRALA